MNANREELTGTQFRKISDLLYDASGINLKPGKEALVRARLMKRVRALGMGSFLEYFSFIDRKEGSAELQSLVDVMTTNKTGFFREAEHFTFVKENVVPTLTGGRVRFWTAACSSGEEPFSLAMLLRESVPDLARMDVRILATDISRVVLEKAAAGVYTESSMGGLSRALITKYFHQVQGGSHRSYRVREDLRSLITFAWLNLVGQWPVRGPFKVVFCRNVMIYFDRPTQQNLVNRFWDVLEPGGYLLVGHSEGLSAISHKFRYVRPAVYRK